MFLQLCRFVGLLPGKLGFVATKVTVAGGLAIDRFAQLERFNDSARREVEVLTNEFGNLVLVDLASVDTFGTGDEARAEKFVEQFSFKPANIIQELDLLRPIYRQTTNYGHFGKAGLPWEKAQVAVGA